MGHEQLLERPRDLSTSNAYNRHFSKRQICFLEPSVMVSLFCSCVKITDPATIPINEVCFYASVLVSSTSWGDIST